MNCLAALTFPSGPRREPRAQLDSPIASSQIQQLTGAVRLPLLDTSLQSGSALLEAKNVKRHVIAAIMMMIAAAYLIPLRVANGANASKTSGDMGHRNYTSGS